MAGAHIYPVILGKDIKMSDEADDFIEEYFGLEDENSMRYVDFNELATTLKLKNKDQLMASAKVPDDIKVLIKPYIKKQDAMAITIMF